MRIRQLTELLGIFAVAVLLAYRFRVLNGSNARFYKLTWSDQTPMTVIGGDGGGRTSLDLAVPD